MNKWTTTIVLAAVPVLGCITCLVVTNCYSCQLEEGVRNLCPHIWGCNGRFRWGNDIIKIRPGPLSSLSRFPIRLSSDPLTAAGFREWQILLYRALMFILSAAVREQNSLLSAATIVCAPPADTATVQLWAGIMRSEDTCLPARTRSERKFDNLAA